ncbi:class F sortase [Lapillicoccus jejuensis]|uniref:Sortase family protein n=1 Tax=Lapillicoccus jejuensis TaxID=402171 RepID=A0A542E0H7_9MICO|nr:class F sortase [Lapillicoccus jejuensis]TQJ08684.1 sortase family protein [Lapillicoccus jejuensis]
MTVPSAVAALGGAVLLAGCGAAGGASTLTPSTAATTTSAPPSTSPDGSPTGTTPTGTTGATAAAQAGEVKVPAGGSSGPAVPAGLRPVRIQAPSIGLDAVVGELGLAADGSVQVPSDPDATGWFDQGPAPGQRGPAVVLGHVDSRTGPAVFARLRDLKVGDPVVVTLRDGAQARFTVDGTLTFAKSDFPTAATYGPVPGPALRLITCGGAYVRDRGGYQSNVVVFAS